MEFYFMAKEALEINAIITPRERSLSAWPSWVQKAEAYLEDFRLKNNPDSPSRLNCLFGAPDKEELIELMMQGCAPWKNRLMYRAETLDDTKILITDPELFVDLCESLSRNPFSDIILPEKMAQSHNEYLARLYFSDDTQHFASLKEALYCGRLKILEKIDEPEYGWW